MSKPLHTVIIGAGIGGINMAVRLVMAGNRDFTILEKAEDVGGTWHYNTYQGLTCDVNSFIMSYSWDLIHASYPNFFSPPSDFKSNLQRVAKAFELEKHLKFNYTVKNATWDEDAGLWNINGGEYKAKYVVRATGMLTEPNIPNLPGLADHKSVCHSSRWNLSAEELAGKKVAVLGAGASGIQIVTALADKVEHMTVFQPTPMWVIPRIWTAFGESDYNHRERLMHEKIPETRFIVRSDAWRFMEGLFPISIRPDSAVCHQVQGMLAQYLSSQVEDEAKRSVLTPNYVFGGTRIIRDTEPSFYRQITRDNVTIVSKRATGASVAGVECDGKTFDADHIILATGFKVTSTHFDIIGKGGVNLGKQWGESPVAYRSITAAGFPNLFFLYGPNSNTANFGVTPFLEGAANFVMQMQHYCDQNNYKSFDVTTAAQAEWKQWIDNESAKLSWTAASNHSWYKNSKNENVTTFPGNPYDYFQLLKQVDTDHFAFTSHDGKAVAKPAPAPQCHVPERPPLGTVPLNSDPIICPVCLEIQDLKHTSFQLSDAGKDCFKGTLCVSCARPAKAGPAPASPFANPISPMARAFLKQGAEAGLPDLSLVPVPVLRAVSEGFNPFTGPPEPCTITDRTVVGPAGDISVRVYKPEAQAANKSLLLYMHGGGWVVGDLVSHNSWCSALCARSGSVVVAIDYRRAPEAKCPAAFDDCYAVAEWAAKEGAAELGCDSSKIVVAGDSAGGCLAAGITIRARDNKGPALAGQVLMYPVTDASMNTASYDQLAEGFLLTRSLMARFFDEYCSSEADRALPHVSPLRSELSGLPPAFVGVCGYDILRDEGKAYAEKLAAAGVSVTTKEYVGEIHIFVQLYGMFWEAKTAANDIAEFVKNL